jgi:formamidopyrimidine-DNA glycosylase
MPELPEVETVCRALEPHLVDRRIRGIRAHVTRLRKPVNAPRLRRLAADRQVRAVRRRAKFIILELTDRRALVIHLGMTGSLRICRKSEPLRTHDRVSIVLDRREELRLEDPRRFGSVGACILDQAGGDPPDCSDYGPEPLLRHFSGEYLHRISRKRRVNIKNLIMNQAAVVGVGNIYASEALWRARIRPTRAAGRLSRRACDQLVEAIRHVLRAAIRSGGTTLENYRQPDGSEGRFRHRLRVYGREDLSCPRCRGGSRIRRIVQSGRSTYYCPTCQR